MVCLKANKETFGTEALAAYDFSKAETVVSFGADFLGTWISPVEYAAQWSKTRKLGKGHKEMSRLYAIESNMSLTGCNADYRQPIKPSEQGLHIVALHNKIASATGGASINATQAKPSKVIDKAAQDLLNNRGKSIVVSGSNDPNVQMVVNAINNMLGNYGKTIDLSAPVYMKQGNDEQMASLG